MAGYMTKLNGHIYDGSSEAGEALTNGLFVEKTDDGTKKVTATKDTVMRVEEKTTLWGKDALRLDVVSVGSDEVFLTENEWDINDSEEYDEANYEIKIGDKVRMHRPLIGEQMIVSVDST